MSIGQKLRVHADCTVMWASDCWCTLVTPKILGGTMLVLASIMLTAWPCLAGAAVWWLATSWNCGIGTLKKAGAGSMTGTKSVSYHKVWAFLIDHLGTRCCCITDRDNVWKMSQLQRIAGSMLCNLIRAHCFGLEHDLALFWCAVLKYWALNFQQLWSGILKILRQHFPCNMSMQHVFLTFQVWGL